LILLSFLSQLGLESLALRLQVGLQLFALFLGSRGLVVAGLNQVNEVVKLVVQFGLLAAIIGRAFLGTLKSFFSEAQLFLKLITLLPFCSKSLLQALLGSQYQVKLLLDVLLLFFQLLRLLQELVDAHSTDLEALLVEGRGERAASDAHPGVVVAAGSV